MRSLNPPSLCLLQLHFITFSKVGVNKTASSVSPRHGCAAMCIRQYLFDKKAIGKGGFASVYAAKHNQTGQKVAIKVIAKPRSRCNPEKFRVIIKEVSTMMALKRHPLITKIDRVFNEQKKISIVLEFLPGGELFDFILLKEYLDEGTTRFLFWQLLTATKYLHDNGVVHCDLKPENILLANEQSLQIKIADFGLAQIIQENEVLDSWCGTADYMAPEIMAPFEVRGYTQQCDLWSLGVVMYVCLCGFSPFSYDEPPATVREKRIKEGKYQFMQPYWDNVSDEAKWLIKGLLKVEPSKRLTVGKALTSKWMEMNPDELSKWKNGLGIETNKVIADLGMTQ